VDCKGRAGWGRRDARMTGWVGWGVLDPLPGKGGATPNSCVDTQVNLVRLRSNTVLARDAMGQELKE
jgi:hypothetical protein